MPRRAVRVAVMRIMRDRIRIAMSGGGVRYGVIELYNSSYRIARTPAESLTLAECQNTKRRGISVGS